MDQPTFADLEYQGKKRRTRRELFLERMDGLIPWRRLEERIRPVYPKPGKGRRPYPLAVCCESTVSSCSTISATPALRTPVFAGAGSALRGRISQAVRGAEPVGGAARRDHDTQLPSSPGKAQTGQGLVR